MTQPEVEPATTESLNADPRRVAVNAAAGYATLLVSSGLGFVTTPILLHGLGVTRFGLYYLVLSAIAYVGVLELGLGTTVLTRVAAVERQGVPAIQEVLSAARRLYFFVIVAGCPVLAGLAMAAPWLFHAPKALTAELAVAVVVAGMWQFVTFGAAVYAAALIGTGRAAALTFTGFLISTATTLGQVLVASRGGNLVDLYGLLALGAVATMAVQRKLVRRALPALRVRGRSGDRSVGRQLVSQSWRNGVAQTAGALAFGSDILLVGLLLSPVAAAAYAVAQKVSLLLTTLSTKVATVLTPVYAHLGSVRSPLDQFRVYTDALSISWLLAVPLGLSASMFSQPLLDLWLPEVPSHSAAVLMVLGAMLPLQMPGYNAFVLFQGTERLGLLATVTTAAAAMNVVVSVALTLKLGVLGPALGSLIAVITVDALLLPLIVSRQLHQTARQYARMALLPSLPAIAAAVAVATMLRVSPFGHGLAVLPCCALVCATYWSSWWYFGATARQRAALLRLLPSRLVR